MPGFLTCRLSVHPSLANSFHLCLYVSTQNAFWVCLGPRWSGEASRPCRAALIQRTTDLPTLNANIATCLKDARRHFMWQHSCSVPLCRYCLWGRFKHSIEVVWVINGVEFAWGHFSPNIPFPLLFLLQLENQNPAAGEILWLTVGVVGLQDGNKIRMSSVSLSCGLANQSVASELQ